jgi:hypothetical protein
MEGANFSCTSAPQDERSHLWTPNHFSSRDHRPVLHKAEAAEELGVSRSDTGQVEPAEDRAAPHQAGAHGLYRRDTLKAWLIAQEEAEVQRRA